MVKSNHGRSLFMAKQQKEVHKVKMTDGKRAIIQQLSSFKSMTLRAHPTSKTH